MARSNSHVPQIGRHWVTIGVVVRPFGRYGELKVRPETSFPERFAVGTRLFVWLPREHSTERPKRTQPPRECLIVSVRWHQDFVLLGLEGIQTIEQAEGLRGAWLLIPSEERMPLPEDEYYISDLIGMKVYTEAGEYLGRLREVIQTGAHDLYRVGSLLIPAIKQVVLQVDLPNQRMTVRLPPGLEPARVRRKG